jgi:hypothetical protein
MIGNKGLLVTITVALGVLGVTSALGEVGRVRPCSLHGVNPAHHSEIFDNPTAAREQYGFVQIDGKWQVEKNCRRNLHRAALSVPSLLQALEQDSARLTD